MLVGLSPRDLPLRWEDMMHNSLEIRLQMSNFAFEAYRGCRQNLRLVLRRKIQFHSHGGVPDERNVKKKRECCFETSRRKAATAAAAAAAAA